MAVSFNKKCVGYAIDLILAAAPDAFGIALGTHAGRIARAGLQPASPTPPRSSLRAPECLHRGRPGRRLVPKALEEAVDALAAHPAEVDRSTGSTVSPPPPRRSCCRVRPTVWRRGP